MWDSSHNLKSGRARQSWTGGSSVWETAKGRAFAGQVCSVGMLGEGWGQSTAVLALAPSLASWAKWG